MSLHFRSYENAETLFPSDVDEEPQVPKKKHDGRKRKHASTRTTEPAQRSWSSPSRASPTPGPSTSATPVEPSPVPPPSRPSALKKPHQTRIKPIPPKKCTVYDLFGTDSEDDEKEVPAVTGKTPLASYITRRLANGHSRQIYEKKPGTHYIDLKIYRCDEIEKVPPMNRWRQAIVTVKNQTFDNTDAWQHLSNFIMATRKEYVKCPPTFVSNYY